VDTLDVMLTLELVAEQPDWNSALQVALTRRPGVPERRAQQDPWAAPSTSRPRRISDDLSWLRAAVDEPPTRGLYKLRGDRRRRWFVGEAIKEGSELRERFRRLDQRGVLDAAGFCFR
jgi:hypothetical protein